MVLYFNRLKPFVMSSREKQYDRGDDKMLKDLFNWNIYSFWREDKGSDARVAMTRRIELPKSVKLSGLSSLFNGMIVNGVYCTDDR